MAAADEKLHLSHGAHGQKGLVLKPLQTSDRFIHTSPSVNENVGINYDKISHFTLPTLVRGCYAPRRCYPPCLLGLATSQQSLHLLVRARLVHWLLERSYIADVTKQ